MAASSFDTQRFYQVPSKNAILGVILRNQKEQENQEDSSTHTLKQARSTAARESLRRGRRPGWFQRARIVELTLLFYYLLKTWVSE